MSDLLKRLNFTVGAGVIGPGSSHHEYHVAESQVREAMSLIQKLEKENAELRAALRDLWKYAAVPYQRSFLGKHPKHRATIERLQEQSDGDG